MWFLVIIFDARLHIVYSRGLFEGLLTGTEYRHLCGDYQYLCGPKVDMPTMIINNIFMESTPTFISRKKALAHSIIPEPV